ncbi:MAG: alpha/beta hydrolase family protein, partial [Vicinamibacterales bacterium]
MNSSHSIRLVLVAALTIGGASVVAQNPAAIEGQTYTVFLRSRVIGQETVSIVQQADGWLIRGTNRLGLPLDVLTRIAEIHYDSSWRPTRLLLDGVTRAQEVSVKTTFANGQAATELIVAGAPSTKTDAVAADTIVLPNAFLGSNVALARRLIGQKPGATFRGYIAPQGEVAMRLDGVSSERIETAKEVIASTRYAVIVSNPPPGGDMQVSIWTDAQGSLLRMSVPAQMLELARDDIASAATRTSSFSLPGDETVRIPAAGFGIAASVAKPASPAGPLPAVILIGGSGPIDRDGFVAGIPVLGQIARELVNAGFLVVRYDKRGIGQSGGRAETSTINDHAQDVRSILSWLERQRKEIDKKRIGLVGHSEGAWVAMTVAARDDRVAALSLIAAPATTGAELVLEQQRHLLDRLKASDDDRKSKIELQQKINVAAAKGTGWDEIPPELRRAADTPWFQSFLAFDPARVLRDVRQPILIVQGELDTQVRPHHAERLAELARARKRKAAVEVARIQGVNHLL